MLKRAAYFVLFAAVVWAGFSARLFNAEQRATHADEAEQSATFAKLADTGVYKYNPEGPHGATLYYYALACDFAQKIFADAFEVSSGKKSTDTRATKHSDSFSIRTERLWITALDIFVFVLFLSLRKTLGVCAVFAGFACFALSSLCCIYSAYFIQELIFSIAVFGFALRMWNFYISPNWKNALSAGIFAGLAQSTKETAPIAFVSVGAALCVCALLGSSYKDAFLQKLSRTRKAVCAGVFAVGFATVFCIFYSSFGANVAGIADAFSSYLHFAQKANAPEHTQGVFYYIELLLIQKSEGVRFGELPITILFATGICWSILSSFKFRKSGSSAEKSDAAATLYLALAAGFNIAILSAIPYKNPWLMLSPMLLVCAVAGVVAAKLLCAKNRWTALAGAAAVGLLTYWQFGLSSKAAKRYNSDPRNPFIYSHTVSDFKNLVKRIKSCAKVSEYGADIPVAFVTSQSPWPAPWELRTFRNAGFWNGKIPENIDVFQIIVCDGENEKAVLSAIDRTKFEEEIFGLRKNLMLRVYVEKKLFEKSIE